MPYILLCVVICGGAGLTSKCNPEPSKCFITKSSNLRDEGENLTLLNNFDADPNVIYPLMFLISQGTWEGIVNHG